MRTDNQKISVPDLGTREADLQEKTTFTLAELLAMEVKELPCLYKPIFVKSGVAVLFGGSDAGKSTFLRQLAMSVATGRDFLGWQYNGTHHRAIYFSSEDDDRLTARVVQTYNKTMKLPTEARENLRFCFEINPDNLHSQLAEMLKEQPADLVVIDAFGDAFNGKSMNDNNEIRKFYAPFKTIARECDCLIIFNHHSGKRSDVYSPSKDNSLGSQAIEAVPRLAIELRSDPDNPDIRHFCITKCNYLGSDFKRASYVLKQDENFVYYSTGERVEFEQLAKNAKPQRKTKPLDYDDATHRNFIQETFAEVANLNQREFASAIAERFDITDRTAKDKWIPFYTKKSMVAEVEGKNAKNARLYRKNIR